MLDRLIAFPLPVFSLLVLLGAGACAPAMSPSLAGPTPGGGEPEAIPEIEPAAPQPARPRNILGSARYDLPVEANRWVEAELDFLVGQRAYVITRWLEGWDFYGRYVERVFAAHGIPTDLQHLAMVESGYNPTARSRAGAVGMWQFMPATGRGMGLRVDSVVDERMDPVRSTLAAARHLRALHRSFGDWPLAAAAYNAGGGRIRDASARSGASGFWQMVEWGYLPQETRSYVPRLYAVTIIAHDRTRWGFTPRNPASPHFAVDSVQTDLPTPLSELARVGGLTTHELGRLNPHLLRATTPEGRYWIWVPNGTGRSVQEAYLRSDFRRQGGFARYRVRAGDDLGALAELAGVDVDRIRSLNPDLIGDPLRTGQSLLLPADAARLLSARPVSMPGRPLPPKAAPVAPDSAAPVRPLPGVPVRPDSMPVGPREYVVRPGDTLYSLARRYGTTVAAIRMTNQLEGETITLGQTLVIPR
jgi:membrane-bound lytic murein transglycosylase D